MAQREAPVTAWAMPDDDEVTPVEGCRVAVELEDESEVALDEPLALDEVVVDGAEVVPGIVAALTALNKATPIAAAKATP